MKFLKKDVVEGNAVAAVIDNMALSHPEVSIRLIRDGGEALHTPGDGKLQSVIYCVFGREIASSMIPVDYTYEKIHVYGAISLPRAARASPQHAALLYQWAFNSQPYGHGGVRRGL